MIDWSRHVLRHGRSDPVVRGLLPNFGDQIVDGVPSDGAVSEGTPPTHEIGGFDIRVSVEVIRDGYLSSSEGRRNETNAELGRVRW